MEIGKALSLRKFNFEKLGEIEFENAVVIEGYDIQLTGNIAFARIQNTSTIFPVKSATLTEYEYERVLVVDFDTTGWPIEIEDAACFELNDPETTLALNISLCGIEDPVVKAQMAEWSEKRLFGGTAS